jgi:hypothetical protein
MRSRSLPGGPGCGVELDVDLVDNGEIAIRKRTHDLGCPRASFKLLNDAVGDDTGWAASKEMRRVLARSSEPVEISS